MTQFSRGLPGYSNEGATSSLGEILGIAMEEGLAVEAMGEALKQLQDEAAEDETEEDDIEQGSDEGKAELNPGIARGGSDKGRHPHRLLA
jgi:hypothetical protein